MRAWQDGEYSALSPEMVCHRQIQEFRAGCKSGNPAKDCSSRDFPGSGGKLRSRICLQNGPNSGRSLTTRAR